MKIRIPAVCALSVLFYACDSPKPGDAFWWNWWVTGAAAIATLLAVAAAIAGPVVTELMRARWFPAKLAVTLLSIEGEPGINRYRAPGGEEQEEGRRFYHLRVSNGQRRVSPAEDVQVSVLRIDESGPGGSWYTAWVGEIPLTWRNQQISPLRRTIGADYDCDLCSVGRDTGLGLALLTFPFHLASYARMLGARDFKLTVQAKANRTDSPLYVIRIAWNGTWAEAASEMKNRLVITQE